MKLSKIQIIVGVVLIILITLLFSLMTKTQRKIEESKIVALSQVKKENEITLESILIKHNVQLIYVDGIKQDKVKLLDTFIGTELKKGNHKIVLKYKPKVLYISIMTSILGLILL